MGSPTNNPGGNIRLNRPYRSSGKGPPMLTIRRPQGAEWGSELHFMCVGNVCRLSVRVVDGLIGIERSSTMVGVVRGEECS